MSSNVYCITGRQNQKSAGDGPDISQGEQYGRVDIPRPFAISLTLSVKIAIIAGEVNGMNMQVVKWCVDLAMGIVFLFSAVTGFFKFTLLLRLFGLTDIVLPLAQMSNIHDWAGITLCLLVLLHLFLNRAWILSMTRKMMNGTVDLK